MSTTRKQKKARKSGGLEILSDIENLDIRLSGRHSERQRRASIVFQVEGMRVPTVMRLETMMRTCI